MTDPAQDRTVLSIRSVLRPKLEAVRAELIGSGQIRATAGWTEVLEWLCDHRDTRKDEAR